MPGLLDPSTLYPDFLDPSGKVTDIFNTPEYRRQRIFDTLGGIGAALLQAGSRPGADFGSSLAAGLAGGLQAGAGSEDRLLKRMMVQSQITKNRQEQANESAWQNLFKTPIAASGATPSAGTPTSSGGAPWSPTTDAKDLVAHLVNRGLTPMQAAVAVGNFQQESGLNPTTVHDSGTGYGLGGWRLDRRDALNRYAGLKGGNVADPKLQADFFVDELKGRPEWQAFSQAQDPRTAASALMNYFRPAGWTPDNPTAGHGFDNRLQFANALFPGGTQIAQGDASGNPVQLAQATQPAFRPQTMQDVVQTIPPGVRQLIGAMPRKEGLPLLMKYADPGSEAVLDTQSNQVVFIPKTMVGRDPRYQPVENEKLNLDRQRLTLEQDRARRSAVNDKITLGLDDKPVPNETTLEYERRQKAIEDEFKQAEEKRKQEAGQSEKTFGQEKQVRQEYESQPAVKSYRVVVPMMEAAAKAGPTRAGDLNLVYAFAKLMDPDSVVRESETAGVQATGNLSDRVMGYVGMLNGNPTLSPETRAKLMDELQTRFVALKESNDVLASQYTDIAKAYGLDPSRVVIPIRKPGAGKSAEGNQPTQDELKGWANNSPGAGGGVRLKYVPGKGTMPVRP